MIVKNSGSEFKSVEPGTYPARCTRVIDLGTQHSEYQGKPIERHQMLISWELPTELMTVGEDAGMPYIVSSFFTASLNERSNLRKQLENWRGRAFTDDELQGFDMSKLLGKACMVSIQKTDTGKTKVSGVSSPVKGLIIPETSYPLVMFRLDKYDEGIFNSLSDGIKKIIMKSPEWQGINGFGHAFDESQPQEDTTTEPF